MKNYEKTMQREQKQLLRLSAHAAKPIPKIYPILLLIMITLVHLLDSYASDVISKSKHFI